MVIQYLAYFSLVKQRYLIVTIRLTEIQILVILLPLLLALLQIKLPFVSVSSHD